MHRWVAWNILFRLHERVKGHDTYRVLGEMEAADRLSVPELESLQQARLRDFLDYCYAHVPFVRNRMKEAGVAPGQIRSAQDLWLIPATSKDDIRKHRAELRSDIAAGLTPFSTGGSTGEPLI